MNFDFYAIVNTEGQLNFSEIQSECQKENWSPILVVRVEGKTIVPLFREIDVAKKFIKRNFPRKQIKGVLGMYNENLNLFEKWEIEWQNFPKRYRDRKGVEMSVEVIEIESGFDLFKKIGQLK